MSGYSTAMLPGVAAQGDFHVVGAGQQPEPYLVGGQLQAVHLHTAGALQGVDHACQRGAFLGVQRVDGVHQPEGSNTNDSSSRCASACAMDDTASKPASVAEDTKNFKGCDTTSSSTIKNSGRHCARFAPACRYRLTSTSQKATHPAPTGTRLPTGSLKFFQRPFRPVAHAEQAQAAPNSVAIQA
jgi:hypothetical protein